MDFGTLTDEFSRSDRARRREITRVDGRAVGQGIVRAMRWTILSIASLISFYFVVCVPLAWYQTTLIYWNRAGSGAPDLPAGWQMRRYVSQDPAVEYASYIHRGRQDAPTVVYLHGRGESFAIIRYNVSHYVEMGWNVVVPEYPGFAGLAGTPNERVISAEMSAIHRDLMQQDVAPERLLIHGNSLGAGPALQMAQHPNGFLLVTAPVASMREIVTEYLPYYPTILLRDKWDNVARARTRYPSHGQVVHSADDWVVPVSQGRMLAKAAVTRYRELTEGGHAIASENRSIGFENGRFTISGEMVDISS